HHHPRRTQMVLNQPLQLPVSRIATVPHHQQLPATIPVLLLRRGRRAASRVLRQQFSPNPVDLPSLHPADDPLHSPAVGVVSVAPACYSVCRRQHTIFGVIGPLPAPVIDLIPGGVVTHRHPAHRRQSIGRSVH